MTTNVLVIGGGQAGLAAGYYLTLAGIDFIIVDGSSRVGDSWRNRYDSLLLFTPKGYSELPGLSFPGKKEQLPNKNETADYLETYASNFQLPLHLNTSVISLNKSNGLFYITTNKEDYIARHVIIATGPFHKEAIPDIASKISTDVKQIHSASYKNPEQLSEGDTLVVGAGNSGTQIAVEISKHRKVYLSSGHRPLLLPLHIGGKNIFYWFDKLGILKATAHSFIGKKIQSRPDPIFGFELKKRIKASAITLVPRTIDAKNKSIIFSDGSQREFTNIIWSTGFKPDYKWLELSHVINERGAIKHERGITPESGLYIVGMPWQHRRTSALIGGVGLDAQHVVNEIIRDH
ncbi:flavin-containing monooxygenase [Paenibacillus pasadenensis]|uniref:flavin-containing monooxygenase n=1 Tax=Paenibacillus pasadenensis TaxID=217090 RepID=UPI0004135E05|nr:NAD(P)/FAD-dependent oxidoreductase [Paenibacillus pasadenensis]